MIAKHSKTQNGKMLIEAIAFIGMLMLITPVIVKRTSEKHIEREDAIIAEQMKSIKNAVNNFISNNYLDLSNNTLTSVTFEAGPDGGEIAQLSLTNSDLVPFLPEGFVSSNKLSGADGYEIRLRKENLSLGDSSNVPSISALIVSNPAGSLELTNARGARISSMIGVDGGYTPVDGFADKAEGVAIGGEGLWELDTNKYSDTIGEGKVIASTTVTGGQEASSSSTGGTFLWRTVDGGPEGNRIGSTFSLGGNDIKWLDKIISGVDYNEQFNPTGYTNSTNKADGLVVIGKTAEYDSEGAQIQQKFELNVSGVSQLKDVSLGAFGGASLSEILPTLSLKRIDPLTTATTTITAPDCPVGYAPVVAVVATPPERSETKVSPLINRSSSAPTTEWTITGTPHGGSAYVYCKFVPEAFTELE